MFIKIDMRRLLSAFSMCLDFTETGINLHHQRVAYIGLKLAEEMNLSQENKNIILTASIIHDAGASTWYEKTKLSKFEVDDTWEHCQAGCQLIKKTDLLSPLENIILSHHDKFGRDNKSGLTGTNIPLASRIIHLSDRIDVLLRHDLPVLTQSPGIIQKINELSGEVFDPEIVAAFKNLARRESFWLELFSPFLYRNIEDYPIEKIIINEDQLKQVAGMFANIIDKKSPYTKRHSSGVANTAKQLAASMGFQGYELTFMEIAGLLHDLGKLSIPEEILEKPGKLSDYEYAIIRQHTYYTYHILRAAGAPSPIPEWAAYHHEKLNGKGYPFKLKESELSTGSRIMAAADIFTALREARPYRPGMRKNKIEDIMKSLVLDSALDGKVVDKLFEIYDAI